MHTILSRMPAYDINITENRMARMGEAAENGAVREHGQPHGKVGIAMKMHGKIVLESELVPAWTVYTCIKHCHTPDCSTCVGSYMLYSILHMRKWLGNCTRRSSECNYTP